MSRTDQLFPPNLTSPAVREILLSKGRVAIVDAEDYEELSRWKWHTMVSGRKEYAVRHVEIWKKSRRISKIIIRMHRQIMQLPVGDERKVDHINGNGLHNTKRNLRIATHSQNGMNSAPRRSASGITGVSKTESGKWKARITKEGQRYHLGRFDRIEDAIRARKQAEERLFGEFAWKPTI